MTSSADNPGQTLKVNWGSEKTGSVRETGAKGQMALVSTIIIMRIVQSWLLGCINAQPQIRISKIGSFVVVAYTTMTTQR